MICKFTESYGRNIAGALEITDASDYYPFGMNHLKTGNAYFAQGSYKSNKYNGKELQETGMYSYGWREYMPDIGRWNGIDQLAENYLSASPYAYVLNNPVNRFDPDGRVSQAWLAEAPEWLRDSWTNTPAGSNSYWYNNGNGGFTSYDGGDKGGHAGGGTLAYGSTVGYGGGFTMGDGTYTLPRLVLNLHGTSENWNNTANFGYNSYLMMSKFTGVQNSWNYDQNSSNMGQYILNSKASREVAEFEKFLFIEMPLSFAGGELLSVGWRAAGLSKYICGPVGRLTNGLIKICFTEGTLVATQDGNRKIEDLKEGDQVWSYNEATGRKELKKVVALSRNTSSSLVKITVNGTEITCTPEHPFYTSGTWTAAKDLTPGTLLATLDGKNSPVTSVSILEEKVKVYNFEVEGNHNYYVSKAGILVHNDCGLMNEFMGTFGKYVRNFDGSINMGWLTGETMELQVNAILRGSNAPRNGVMKALTETAESMAQKHGMSEVRIQFNMVHNSFLKQGGWAREYGYYFSREGDTVFWEKVLH